MTDDTRSDLAGAVNQLTALRTKHGANTPVGHRLLALLTEHRGTEAR